MDFVDQMAQIELAAQSHKNIDGRTPDGMSLYTPSGDNREHENRSGFGGRQSPNVHINTLFKQLTAKESSIMPATLPKSSANNSAAGSSKQV